jgi:hypothetical protein
MSYRKLRHFVINSLNDSLSAGLKYHGIHHTLDVLRVCNRYIARFALDKRDAELLRVGALMHDYGFLFTYKDHEVKGVEMAEKIMPQFGYSAEEISTVSGMIWATKVPQLPQNELEQILCDCDLDYLGRSDFGPISESLFQELNIHHILNDRHQWNLTQIKFLKGHEYHTDWAKKYRQPTKALHLHQLMKQTGEI